MCHPFAANVAHSLAADKAYSLAAYTCSPDLLPAPAVVDSNYFITAAARAAAIEGPSAFELVNHTGVMIAVPAAPAAGDNPGTKQEHDMQLQVPVQDVPGEGGEVYTSGNSAYFSISSFMIFAFMETVLSASTDSFLPSTRKAVSLIQNVLEQAASSRLNLNNMNVSVILH